MDSFTPMQQTLPEKCLSDPRAYVAENTRALNREAASRHLHHAISWLLRAVLLVALFLLAHLSLQGELGGIVKGACALMAVYLLLFVFKGHKRIHSRRNAGLYWLQDDAAQVTRQVEIPAARPHLIIAGQIEQEEIGEDPGWMRKQALS